MPEQNGEKRLERRSHPRRIVCMIAHVEPSELPRDAALVRDMSVSGAYLLSRLPVSEGEELLLAIHFPKGDGERIEESDAKVVRVEELDREHSDFWSVGFAVRFAEPLDHLATEIEQASALAARIGLKW